MRAVVIQTADGAMRLEFERHNATRTEWEEFSRSAVWRDIKAWLEATGDIVDGHLRSLPDHQGLLRAQGRREFIDAFLSLPETTLAEIDAIAQLDERSNDDVGTADNQ